jgi:ankyrin repeat protein
LEVLAFLVRGKISCDLEVRGVGTPLELAAALGSLPIVTFLLKHGARANGGRTRTPRPLEAACFGRHSEAVSALLKAGADPEIVLRAPPSSVARVRSDIFRLLVDTMDRNGRTVSKEIRQLYRKP